MTPKQYKGSQRCVLDWLSSDTFLSSLNELLKATDATIKLSDSWLPVDYDNPQEGELKDFLKPHFGDEIGEGIKKWWLSIAHANARTPNWDLLSTATIEGSKGLILVEAKAHAAELDGESKGKPLRKDASENSIANHTQIGNAINEAKLSISNHTQVNISRDKFYQLSNRVAHAWWLANQGIPVVLLYLDFLMPMIWQMMVMKLLIQMMIGKHVLSIMHKK
ncbi:MAG: hypothetical protein N4A71_08065 [Carboxylicivirga sp.]|jgi:hypothetical protein|nr:hypothetical protein [Carboxylicivirga sp.]